MMCVSPNLFASYCSCVCGTDGARGINRSQRGSSSCASSNYSNFARCRRTRIGQTSYGTRGHARSVLHCVVCIAESDGRYAAKVELVDFGATRAYSAAFIDNWLRLLQAAEAGDREACRERSIKLGYLTGEENEVRFLFLFTSRLPYICGHADAWCVCR